MDLTGENREKGIEGSPLGDGATAKLHYENQRKLGEKGCTYLERQEKRVLKTK